MLSELRTHRDRINIAEIAMPEPTRKPFVFSAEKYFTPSGLEKLKQELHWTTSSPNMQKYPSRVAEFSLLFPKQKAELRLPSDLSVYHSALLRGTVHDLQMSDLRIVYPEQFADELLLGPAELPFEKRKEDIRNDVIRNQHIWECFMLFPTRMNEIRAIPGLKSEMLAKAMQEKNNKNWAAFLMTAPMLKLVYPDAVDVSEDDWREIDAYLLTVFTETESWDGLMFCALRAKMLASENIEMTPKGIKFTISSKQADFGNSTPLPLVRNF